MYVAYYRGKIPQMLFRIGKISGAKSAQNPHFRGVRLGVREDCKRFPHYSQARKRKIGKNRVVSKNRMEPQMTEWKCI